MATISTTVLVPAAGVQVSAIVVSGGILDVLGGVPPGYAELTVVSSGGQVWANGGDVVATTVSSGGLQIVNAGVVERTTISTGGSETVASGAATTSTTVSSGGLEIVSAGGRALDIQVFVSGSETVLGTDSAGLISGAGAMQTVSSGGVASGATVSAGGEQDVLAFGSAVGTVVDAGGSAVIEQGGNGNGIDIDSGGVGIVSGTLAAASVNSGGVLSVANHGLDSGTTVFAGGSETVFGGGVASATTVSGVLTVSSGGSAGDAIVNAGQLVVAASGDVSGTTVSGVLTVSSGGTALATTVTDLGRVGVDLGGSLLGGALRGGSIIDNGLISGLTLQSAGTSGGDLLVTDSAAVTSNVTVNAGGAEFLRAAGAVADATIVSSGGVLSVTTGVVSSTVVDSSGVLSLTYSGFAFATRVSAGGTVLVNGLHALDSGGTVFAGGSEVLSSGVVSALTLSGGVLSDTSLTGSAFAVTISSGASALLGGFASGTQVLAGGTATVLYGTESAGTVNGGVEVVEVGGRASGTTIDNGGAQVVSATGSAVGATVSINGTQTVSSGGTALGTVVQHSGNLAVLSGGYASGGSMSGSLLVSAGGSVAAVTIISGGIETLQGSQTSAGIANAGFVAVELGAVDGGALIGAGGNEAVDNGGTVSGADVFGGKLTVSSGGVAQDVTIGAGGLVELQSGAVTSGAIGFSGSGGTLMLDSNAMPAATISGLVGGDTIDLAGLSFVSGSTLSLGAAGVLSVTQGGHTDTLTLAAGTSFAVSADASGGTLLVDAACYAAGTHLATPAGAVPVEALRAGDAVLALQDGVWVAQRVRWVGRSTIDLARHPCPERAAPVRIRAHAFAPDLPRRDLLLSPDHAVLVDGVLIQAQALLNGASVVQEFPARIDYLHVELACHGVLCAEGLPAESYLDTGNRALFAGEAGARPLHPDLANAAAWDERACAPLLLGGARVAAVHARLLARAPALGFASTADAGLRVVAEGRALHLLSHSFVPAWLGLGADRRRLGVAVASLRLGGRLVPRAAFGTGWHAPEPGFRWTDGDAVLHLPAPVASAAALRVRLAPVGARYWVAAEPASEGRPRAAAG